MNRDQMEGNWKQIKGKVRAKWGDLTDDDVASIEGRREALVGKILERYGSAKADAEKAVDRWLDDL
jgi:uncharacterized protein YjbJ (UPF0337 family)